jgi:hypothetical protein
MRDKEYRMIMKLGNGDAYEVLKVSIAKCTFDDAPGCNDKFLVQIHNR